MCKLVVYLLYVLFQIQLCYLRLIYKINSVSIVEGYNVHLHSIVPVLKTGGSKSFRPLYVTLALSSNTHGEAFVYLVNEPKCQLIVKTVNALQAKWFLQTRKSKFSLENNSGTAVVPQISFD